MTAQIIQAQYDELADIAARFQRQAELLNEMTQRLGHGVDGLHNSGWQGRGGEAFVTEVFGVVLPSVNRLEHALTEAQSVTLRVSQTLQMAEEDAAQLFAGEGVFASSPGGHVSAQSPSLQHPGGDNQRIIDVPTNLNDLYRFLKQVPEEDAIQIAQLPNGEYIIGIRGTVGGPFSVENWFGNHSNSWFANMFSGLGIPSVYTERIEEVIRSTIPEGAVVHLAGESQGGHNAQIIGNLLAASGDYNVASVTSFAAYQVVKPNPKIGNSIAYVYDSDILNLVDKFEDGSAYVASNYYQLARNSALPTEVRLRNPNGFFSLPWEIHNQYEEANYGDRPLPFAGVSGKMNVTSYSATETVAEDILTDIGQGVAKGLAELDRIL